MCDDLFHLLLTKRHLTQHDNDVFGRELFKVFFSWCDDESCHVKCARTNHAFVSAFSIIAVGAMLGSGEYHRVTGVFLLPAEQVEHGFAVPLRYRQCTHDALHEQFARCGFLASDEQGGARPFGNDGYILPLASCAVDGLQAALQSWPGRLQGYDARSARLQMCMVGCRGSTMRPVVEHGEVVVHFQQLLYFMVTAVDVLRCMLTGGDGEVVRQNRERIDQQFKPSVQMFGDLFLRAVFAAQETWPFGQGLLADVGSCRYHPCWIILQRDAQRAHFHLSASGSLQVTVVVSCHFPQFHLPVEESQQCAVCHDVSLAGRHLLSCHQFHGAQLVFVEIVGIHLFRAQCGVAVAFPSSAEIQLGEYASNAVSS